MTFERKVDSFGQVLFAAIDSGSLIEPIRRIDLFPLSAPSFPAPSASFSDFGGPGTPGVGGDFSSPGPPPLSYQPELSSALLTPDKPHPHQLAAQVS